MIDPDPSPTSVEAAIAASARRARMLAGVQSIALIALVIIGSRDGCGAPAALDDAGIDAAGGGLDAWIAIIPDAPAPDAAAPCADAAACRAACEAGDGRRPAPCVRWADMLRAGAGGADRDRIAAREQYRRTCHETKDALACARLALAAGLLRDLDVAPDWIDGEHAPLGLLAGACAADLDRGRLACAALELLAPASALARERRTELCRGDGAGRAACAAGVALEACRGADAEACFLAGGEALPTRDEARDRLRRLCTEKDRVACLYRFELSARQPGDQDWLLTACSNADGDREESIARACLIRARINDPRRLQFAELACELGACQSPPGLAGLLRAPGPAVMRKSCAAGHVNGCANLIYAIRATPAAWRSILDEAGRRTPYARRVPPGSPADEVACRLGSLDGCAAAIKRLRATDAPFAARLDAYRRRLIDPLAAP